MKSIKDDIKSTTFNDTTNTEQDLTVSNTDPTLPGQVQVMPVLTSTLEGDHTTPVAADAADFRIESTNNFIPFSWNLYPTPRPHVRKISHYIFCKRHRQKVCRAHLTLAELDEHDPDRGQAEQEIEDDPCNIDLLHNNY